VNFRTRRRRKIISQYAVGWPLGFIFLVLVRSIGTVEQGQFDPGIFNSILISIGLGLTFGIISGYFQYLIEEKFYRKASIKKLVLLKLCYLVAFLLLMITVSYLLATLFFGNESSFIGFASDAGSGIIYAYIIFFDLFMLMMRQISLTLGEGNLWKILTGQFYDPFEEERIFMFIDLQSSTELAEKLGHLKYSQLIQDCFIDLGVTNQFFANVYQYVGDEAVLTWPLENGIKKENCLEAFFAFKEQIESKRKYYEREYQHVPFFKAGINSGIVTVTEVGKYKREIAYHGDTMNTAARIQSKCNEYGVDLLISEKLFKSLDKEKYRFIDKGSVELKGKQSEIELYSVEKRK